MFVADHCAAVAGKSKLPVAGYRIPLIFYAPKLVAPGESTHRWRARSTCRRRSSTCCASTATTTSSAARCSSCPARPARAFISNYQSLGYLRDDVLVVLSPGRKVEAFRVDPATFETTPTPVDRVRADEAIAYYQTASRAFKQGALKAPGYAPH